MAPNPWYWTPDHVGKFVSWYNRTVDITVDLGRAYTINNVAIHAGSYSDYGIQYPQSVAIYYSASDPSAPQFLGNLPPFPVDCTAPCSQLSSGNVNLNTSQIGPPSARYIRYRVVSRPMQLVFLDELVIDGPIPSSTRYAPAPNGNPGNLVYHGAFPTDGPLTGPDYFLDIAGFESSAAKAIASVLWYSSWDHSYAGIESILNSSIPTTKILQLAWGPMGVDVCGCDGNVSQCPCAALDEVNADLARWDTYLTNWFMAARDHNRKIFLRFGSEMNTDWVQWGGPLNGANAAAVQKYVALWRRVYNTARAVNADNIAFVWSPSQYSAPSVSYNGFKKYYPGDQYVDWVGVSLYGKPETVETLLAPTYDAYASSKPFMISEGALDGGQVPNCEPPTTKSAYIDSFFGLLKTRFPRVWATHWFNAKRSAEYCNFRIDETTATSDEYRSEISDARYITQVNGN